MNTGESIGAIESQNDLDAFIHHLDEEGSFLQSIPSRELGKAFYRMGKFFYDKSDLAQAQFYFEKGLKYTEKPGDLFVMFKVLGFLIRISSERMLNSDAEKYIRESELLVDDLTSVLGSLNSEYFYNVGLVKNYRGEFDQARINFELAYKKSKEENEPDLLAKTLLALANACHAQKDFDGAISYLDQLDQLLNIIEKSYLKGSMYLYKGRVYSEMGQLDKAMENFNLAIKKFQKKKSWNLHGYTLLGMGGVSKRLGDYEKSLIYFNLALDMSDATTYKRLNKIIHSEIQDVNDSSIDIYLDRTNRKVIERSIGTIDFKHRFVLLEILFLLAKSPGAYFDKEQLARMIWKDEYNPLIHDKLIYTSVSRLRKLIEPKNGKGEKRKYIIRGKDGYTFNPRTHIRFHLESRQDMGQAIGNVELSSPV